MRVVERYSRYDERAPYLTNSFVVNSDMGFRVPRDVCGILCPNFTIE
jgi:hypothetical protein